MVKTLEKICIRIICSNLNLNYEICEKYGFKIPAAISDKMIKYLRDKDIKVKTDETKIFERRILRLSDFYTQIFDDIFYDFLNGHHLNYLYLENVNEFKLKSSKCKIFTKKLELSILQNKENELLSFLTNFPVFIEETVIISALANNLNSISILFRNTSENLQKLDISFGKFTKEAFLKFISQIFKFQHLEELVLYFVFLDAEDFDEDEVLLDLSNDPKNFGKKLKKLEIPNIFFTFCKIPVNNLTNLECFHIQESPGANSKLCLMTKIFKNLSKQQFSSLKKIDFNFSETNENLEIEFVEFMKNLKNLTHISIGIDFRKEDSKLRMVNYLNNSCSTLQEFYLSHYLKNESWIYLLKSFIGNCTALKSIYLDCLDNDIDFDVLKLLIKLIKNCEANIEKLSLSSFMFKNEWFYSKLPKIINLKKFIMLEKGNFSFTNSLFFDRLLTKVIETQQETLIAIKIEDYSLEEFYREIGCEFFNSIAKCFKLEKLFISREATRNSLEKIFTNSFFQLSHLRKLTIEKFDFTNNDLEYILNLFINLKHLYRVWMDCFNVSKSNFHQFFQRLQMINTNVEFINFRGVYQNNNETFSIAFKNY